MLLIREIILKILTNDEFDEKNRNKLGKLDRFSNLLKGNEKICTKQESELIEYIFTNIASYRWYLNGFVKRYRYLPLRHLCETLPQVEMMDPEEERRHLDSVDSVFNLLNSSSSLIYLQSLCEGIDECLHEEFDKKLIEIDKMIERHLIINRRLNLRTMKEKESEIISNDLHRIDERFINLKNENKEIRNENDIDNNLTDFNYVNESLNIIFDENDNEERINEKQYINISDSQLSSNDLEEEIESDIDEDDFLKLTFNQNEKESAETFTLNSLVSKLNIYHRPLIVIYKVCSEIEEMLSGLQNYSSEVNCDEEFLTDCLQSPTALKSEKNASTSIQVLRLFVEKFQNLTEISARIINVIYEHLDRYGRGNELVGRWLKKVSSKCVNVFVNQCLTWINKSQLLYSKFHLLLNNEKESIMNQFHEFFIYPVDQQKVVKQIKLENREDNNFQQFFKRELLKPCLWVQFSYYINYELFPPFLPFAAAEKFLLIEKYTKILHQTLHSINETLEQFLEELTTHNMLEFNRQKSINEISEERYCWISRMADNYEDSINDDENYCNSYFDVELLPLLYSILDYDDNLKSLHETNKRNMKELEMVDDIDDLQNKLLSVLDSRIRFLSSIVLKVLFGHIQFYVHLKQIKLNENETVKDKLIVSLNNTILLQHSFNVIRSIYLVSFDSLWHFGFNRTASKLLNRNYTIRIPEYSIILHRSNDAIFEIGSNQFNLQTFLKQLKLIGRSCQQLFNRQILFHHDVLSTNNIWKFYNEKMDKELLSHLSFINNKKIYMNFYLTLTNPLTMILNNNDDETEDKNVRDEKKSRLKQFNQEKSYSLLESQFTNYLTDIATDVEVIEQNGEKYHIYVIDIWNLLEISSSKSKIVWPLNLTFNERILSFYNGIFRFFFLLNRCKNDLSGNWLILNRYLKRIEITINYYKTIKNIPLMELCVRIRHFFNQLNCTRYFLSSFLSSFTSYIYVDVAEEQFTRHLQNLKKFFEKTIHSTNQHTESLNELHLKHLRFLHNLMHLLFFFLPKAKTYVTNLLLLITKFNRVISNVLQIEEIKLFTLDSFEELLERSDQFQQELETFSYANWSIYEEFHHFYEELRKELQSHTTSINSTKDSNQNPLQIEKIIHHDANIDMYPFFKLLSRLPSMNK
ncbi:hypothetical protein SNEBB_010123 [Seison nebaliae]|nr:hypothetical protein SNEBB_010123 [Seison nebaliae]